MRLFIALYFDRATEAKIATIQEAFKKTYAARYVPREQWHMTLHFFGEVNAENATKIKHVMDKIPLNNEAVLFQSLDVFEREKGYILHLKLQATMLFKSEKELLKQLKKAGFFIRQKTFKPHLSLARQLHISKTAFKAQQKAFIPFEGRPYKLALIQSTLTSKGALHTPIYERYL